MTTEYNVTQLKGVIKYLLKDTRLIIWGTDCFIFSHSNGNTIIYEENISFNELVNLVINDLIKVTHENN